MHSIFKRIPFVLSGLLFATGTQFLTIPFSGLELASGPNATQLYSVNPATMSINKPGILMNMSHGSWFAGAKSSSLLILFPGKMIPWGIHLKYMDINDLELRGEIPTDEPLATYGANGFSLGALGNWHSFGLRLGVALRYVRIDLYTENSNGFSADIGLFKQVNKKTKIGAVLLNIGNMSNLKYEKPALPRRTLASGSYLFSSTDFSNEITLGIEKSSLVNGVIFYSASETKWNHLSFQVSSKLSKDVSDVSVGTGFQLGIYRFNYGVQIGSQDLGMPQMLDLTILLP